MGRDLRMREDSSGRGTVFPWGEPPATEPIPYAPGEVVISVGDNARGTVTRTSDVVAPLVCVLWDGDKEDVIYPANTEVFRRLYPWEI